MIAVKQTKHGPKDGNCYDACLASILELSISEFTHFTGEEWFQKYQDFLEERFDIGILTVNGHEDMRFEDLPKVYHIISSQLKTGGWHARVGFQGKIVHDPSLIPIKEEQWKSGYWDWQYEFLVPLNLKVKNEPNECDHPRLLLPKGAGNDAKVCPDCGEAVIY